MEKISLIVDAALPLIGLAIMASVFFYVFRTPARTGRTGNWFPIDSPSLSMSEVIGAESLNRVSPLQPYQILSAIGAAEAMLRRAESEGRPVSIMEESYIRNALQQAVFYADRPSDRIPGESPVFRERDERIQDLYNRLNISIWRRGKKK